MDGPRWIERSIAALAAASLLGGCAPGVDAPTVSPTGTPTATATASVAPAPTPPPVATPTVAPTAVLYGPVAVITGVETCDMSGVFGTMTGQGTSVQTSRDGTARCVDTTNDPRVSGDYTATWNMDYWGSPNGTNGAIVQWGRARLVVAGGTWEGRATGVYSSAQGDTIVTWWTGTGDYAGLAYFELVTGKGPWTIHGQIFPGSPPKP